MHLASTTLTAFLALAASATAAPSKPQDACAVNAAVGFNGTTGGWFPYKSAVGCLNTFPINKDIQKSTTETVRRAIDGWYAFTDMASVASKIDGGVWDLKDVDLRKSLKAISTKNYKHEKDFHDDLTFLLRQLGDAHTGYRSLCFHSAYSYYQPWGFDVIVDSKSGKQYVRLAENPAPAAAAGALWENVKKAAGYDPAKYSGWTVKKIDGDDAISYIKKFSDTQVGTVKDRGTRFNVAVQRVTVLQTGAIRKTFGAVTVSSSMEAPAKGSRKYTLVSPEGKTVTIDAPWFARHGALAKPYTDAKSFYTNNCLVAPETSLTRRDTDSDTGVILNDLDFRSGDNVLENAAPINSALKPFPNTTENAFGNGYPKLLKAGEFGSYHLLDAETGVQTLPTFSSDPADGPFGPTAQKCLASLNDPEATANIGTGGPAGPNFYCFIKEIHAGLTLLKKAGAKKVILDWTNNGGGWGDLGTAHVVVMFPNVPRDTARFRSTPFFNTVIKAAFKLDLNLTTPLTMFGPGNFIDPKTHYPPKPSDVDRIFLNPKNGRTETYGKYTSKYSDLISIVDGGAIFDETQRHNVFNVTGIPKPTKPLWDPKNVILLTNGFCGSTCAHGARLAVDHVGIRSVVKGGVAGSKPFSFSSFPGGNVVDIDQIFHDPAVLGLAANPLTPQPFKNAVSLMRVNAGVGYSDRKDLPAEYARKTADCRIEITEKTINPAFAWKEAAKKFQGCKKH
ncbi:uncharacterized protein EV422DRAFT_578156 [Fimicolochytrium jonesii]|uniref:uncharacterized protein n=1 Tax=Fimicolochytrium jonesii TaxID=1396493 RepID=UPI0022FE753B|nr:uncharacterized protein EV422DRAFT_578156 [Fimicolochytrium jonesii]KAI8821275.1 hypothetical protein EV422DRAFT_578156 [Fimicolochytrium jonesii]